MQNRTIILAAAKGVFRTLGFDKATVRDIVRQTDLSPGTFYNYFTDKEEVFRTIIDEYLEALSERVKDQRQGAKGIEGFIGPAYRTFFSAIADDPDTFELARKNESVLTAMYHSPLMDIITADLQKDIRDAIHIGFLPPIDPELLSSAFIGIGYELGVKMLKADSLDPEKLSAFATALFLGGIPSLPLSE